MKRPELRIRTRKLKCIQVFFFARGRLAISTSRLAHELQSGNATLNARRAIDVERAVALTAALWSENLEYFVRLVERGSQRDLFVYKWTIS